MAIFRIKDSNNNFIDFPTQLTVVGGDTLPIGTMVPYGNENPPINWLICDGSAVLRDEYPELFAVIGTSYGEGDGSTTFNLPDKRGKISVGLNVNDESFENIGVEGGTKSDTYNLEHSHTTQSHTLTTSEMPWHTHYQQARTSDGNFNPIASVSSGGTSGGATDPDSGSYGWTNTGSSWLYTTGSGGSEAHTHGDTGASLSTTEINNLQPYQVDQWIIKAFFSAGVVATTEQNLTSESTINVPSVAAVKYALDDVKSSIENIDSRLALQNLGNNNYIIMQNIRDTEDIGLTNVDLNNMTKPGIYALYGTCYNVPIVSPLTAGYGTLYVTQYSEVHITQLLITGQWNADNPNAYFRSTYNDETTMHWSSWHKIVTTNASSMRGNMYKYKDVYDGIFQKGSGDNYLMIRTPVRSDLVSFNRIKIEGYAYRNATPWRATLVWYNYNNAGTMQMINSGWEGHGPDAIWISFGSDGYCYLIIHFASDNYFNFFTITDYWTSNITCATVWNWTSDTYESMPDPGGSYTIQLTKRNE